MPYGSMLNIQPTKLLLLAAKQEPYKKAFLLMKNIEYRRIFCKKKKSRENGPAGKKKERRKKEARLKEGRLPREVTSSRLSE